MKLTDTHCHLDYDKFDADRDVVIARASEAGLVRMLVPGLHGRSSRNAVALAESHDGIYAAVGFHPTDLEEFSEQAFEQVKELAGHAKVVAIGEIGLDYFWVKSGEHRAVQQEILERHLALAEQINKPVVIHMREEQDAWFGQASLDLLDILTRWHAHLQSHGHPLVERPGVFHSFNGNLETAQKALAMGFYLGITGPVTYKNAEAKREIVRQLPLDKLLIETDSPFLAPVPHRGLRNEPAFVHHIADKIAEIHSKNPAEIAAITTANAARLFSWGD